MRRRIAREAVVFFGFAGLLAVLPGCPMILGLDKDFRDIGQPDAGEASADAPADVQPENACGNGRLICNGSCIDVTADTNNCGVCGRKCGQGFTCAMGQCGNDVVQLAAGGAHGCVVLRAGKVWCWGNNTLAAVAQGTMGDMMCGTQKCRPAPLDTGLDSAAEVVLAAASGCARKSDGTVWCWGSNGLGQLGHTANTNGDVTCGATPCNPKPVQVMGLPAVQQIGAGYSHYCALTTTGAVYCWGSNTSGELGRQTAAGGSSPSAQLVPALSGNVKQLSTGLGYLSCALKMDGTVWCWGSNIRGGLGHATAGDPLDGALQPYSSTPQQILKDNQNNPFTGLERVSTQWNGGCAKKGTSWFCWGNHGRAALGFGAGFDTAVHATPAAVTVVPTGVATLAHSYETPCAIDPMGKLFCWGRNDWGAIGDSTFAGLPCEGAIPCRPDAQPIAVLGAVDMVTTNSVFALARKPDNTVWSWGANPDARLGHVPGMGGDAMTCATGTTFCNPKPTQIMGLP